MRTYEIEWHADGTRAAGEIETVEADPAKAGQARSFAIPDMRLGMMAQWSRLMEIVRAFCLGVGRAHAMHAAARTQLEVAEFSMENIFDDISGLIKPTAAMLAARLRTAGGAHRRATL